MNIGMLLLGAAFSLLVVAAAFRSRALTTSGCVAAFLIGTLVFGLGGFANSLTLVFFFVSSSLLTRLPSKDPLTASLNEQVGGPAHEADEKGRNWKQVIANGLGPGIAVMLTAIWPQHEGALRLFFLGSIATATADTWATEIGRRYGGVPRSIVTMRRLTIGESGGVTLLGLLAALLGALAIGMIGELYPNGSDAHMGRSLLSIATLSGMTCSVADSLLGATFQTRYRCTHCQLLTETSSHCGQRTTRVSGISGLDNSGVNLATTLLGGIVAVALGL